MFMKRLGAFFLDTIEILVFAIAIFLFIYLLVLQPHKIKGASMKPNFHDGEYLLTDKVTYRLREPQRGDVIVFEAPADSREEFIKRIIAQPGEIFEIKEGSIFINGEMLSESYLQADVPTAAGSFLKENEKMRVPEEQYIVLGDNRKFSSDSRTWGYVSKDKITGRAFFIYWPIAKFGILEDVMYILN
ncbi:MAG: signal peptidase I [Patescibacteria group bacterium]